MVLRGSVCRLLPAQLEWELFLLIQVCVKRLVLFSLPSVTGPKRMAGTASGRFSLGKSSSPRGLWGTEKAAQGMGTAPGLPELQNSALRDWEGFWGVLCRTRSWT